MAYKVQTVIDIALAEVGYLEKKDGNNLYDKTANAGSANYTKYGYEMNQIYPSVMDYPAAWCDAFVDWCFYKAYGVANAKKLLGGNFDDYTVNSAQLYKNKNAWHTSNPQVGDQIFFTNGTRIYHTGLVYKVDSTYVYTIEGNTSSDSGVIANGGAVACKKYTLNYAKIAGYGRPKYDDTSTTSTTTTTTSSSVASGTPNLKKGSKGTQVTLLQQNLNQVMSSGLTVDGIFGTNTYKAVVAFQKKYGLTVDGIYGPASQAKMTTLISASSTTTESATSSSSSSSSSTSSSLAATTTADPETIWKFLSGKGLNDYAVAGIMGNLYAESGLLAINLQNTYNTKLGMTDIEYTNAVDAGTYTNFVKDSAGYGIAQWTYSTRKQALLTYATSIKASIGNLSMQLDYLWKELQTYSAVMKVLKAATSVKQASDIVLTGFEKPANQSDSVKTTRASYGQKYYDKYASSTSSSSSSSSSSSTNSTSSTIPTLASCSPNLKKGSKGTQVKYLQQDLNYVLNSGLTVDGIFGTKTYTALRTFQKKYGLSVDGIYGKNSYAKMKTLLV